MATLKLAPHFVDPGWGVTVYGQVGGKLDDGPHRHPRVRIFSARGLETKVHECAVLRVERLFTCFSQQTNRRRDTVDSEVSPGRHRLLGEYRLRPIRCSRTRYARHGLDPSWHGLGVPVSLVRQRVTFLIAVNGTDDHLRRFAWNTGGWELSTVFHGVPTDGRERKTFISGHSKREAMVHPLLVYAEYSEIHSRRTAVRGVWTATSEWRNGGAPLGPNPQRDRRGDPRLRVLGRRSQTRESLLTGYLESTHDACAIASIEGILHVQVVVRRQYGLPWIFAMPTNLYEPNDDFSLKGSHLPTAIIRRYDQAAKCGADLVTNWGAGVPRRDFLYSDDKGRVRHV